MSCIGGGGVCAGDCCWPSFLFSWSYYGNTGLGDVQLLRLCFFPTHREGRTPGDGFQSFPDIAKYWPGCIVPINGLACVEEVMRQKGTYAGKRPMHTSQPLTHLAPGDVIYLPIGHIVYVEDYNYSKDPNADMTPRDAPILSHWLPIPGNYYGVEYTTIDVSKVEVYKYGMLSSTAERAGGFSYRDTFKILLVKEHMTETGYDLYKKLRLDVILEVRDGSGKPLRDALIELDGKTYKTGSKGRIIVELEPDKYRDRDLPFVIRKAGFKDEKRALYAFQMKPSAEFLTYPVDMEAKDLDILIGELDKKLDEKAKRVESRLQQPCRRVEIH